MVDWNDPASRLAHVERVGTEVYNAELQAHLDASIVETVNGYPIRPVVSLRFGRIYMVVGTDTGYATLERARAAAKQLPPR